MGVGMIGFSNTTNALIIDLSRRQAGTATAANNLTRCLVGAAASYAILPMTKGMGIGWAFTFLAASNVLFSPALLIIMKYGMKWRRDEKTRLEALDNSRDTTVESTNAGPATARQESELKS